MEKRALIPKEREMEGKDVVREIIGVSELLNSQVLGENFLHLLKLLKFLLINGLIRIEITFLETFVANVKICKSLPMPLLVMVFQVHVHYLFSRRDRDWEGLGSPDHH